MGPVLVALVGPPGAGKTAVLEATCRNLRGRLKLAVIVVNPAAKRDAERLCRYCARVEPVEACAPDAPLVQSAVERIGAGHADLILVESVGGICGLPRFGQHATATVLSVCGGDDKAAEYAALLAGSQALLLSKSDLRRHVMFDRGLFRADVHRINPDAELIELSAYDNAGIDRWLAWLLNCRAVRTSAIHSAQR